MKDEDFREFIDTLKASVDIADVISNYIEVDRNGKGLCPFHPDTVTSLSVNREEQYWNCFGCKVGGDVIRFIELYNKVS